MSLGFPSWHFSGLSRDNSWTLDFIVVETFVRMRPEAGELVKPGNLNGSCVRDLVAGDLFLFT